MKKKAKDFLNNNKFIIIAIVALLVVGSSVAAFSGSSQNVTESGDINVTNNYYSNSTQSGMLGSAEMPDCANAEHLSGCPSTGGNQYYEGSVEIDGTLYTDGESYITSLTSGSGTLASSTSGAVGTLTQADLIAYSILDVESTNSVTFALTLPATSTMTTLMPNAGNMRSWMIQNASTTAGVAMTITAGAGIELIGVDTNVDVIDGNEWSVMNCYRRVNTDVVCELSELVHVD